MNDAAAQTYKTCASRLLQEAAEGRDWGRYILIDPRTGYAKRAYSYIRTLDEPHLRSVEIPARGITLPWLMKQWKYAVQSAS